MNTSRKCGPYGLTRLLYTHTPASEGVLLYHLEHCLTLKSGTNINWIRLELGRIFLCNPHPTSNIPHQTYSALLSYTGIASPD